MSEEVRQKMREAKLANPTRYWLGKKRDEKTLQAMKATQFKKGESGYPESQFKKGHTLNKGKKRPEISGSNHYNWQGGITSANESLRHSLEYKQWRETVFKRDDYRCFDCGERGGELQADHIYPFSLFPRLRLDINNGITLCKECHFKTPTWGGRVLHFTL